MCSICIASVIQFSVKFKARTPLVFPETNAEGIKLRYKVNTLSPKQILHKLSHNLTHDVWKSVYDCLKSHLCSSDFLLSISSHSILTENPPLLPLQEKHSYLRKWKFLHFHLPFSWVILLELPVGYVLLKARGETYICSFSLQNCFFEASNSF